MQKVVGDWQQQLRDAVTEPAELLRMLGLANQARHCSEQARSAFALRVPHSFIARMAPNDPNDPLLRQVLPLSDEMQQRPGYALDPLGEASVSPVPGLLHKYHGRVLLVMSGACAVNCRYCFRRHFPYSDHVLGGKRLEECLAYVSSHSSIFEVILSGGEPLLLKDDALFAFVNALAKIPHVKYLRIHTRLPIVIPDRVTAGLFSALTSTRLKPVVVLHANHPNEIDDTVGGACRRLSEQGVTVLNQAVLLRGVNVDVQVLVSLSQRLFEVGVMPYYLHKLDKVQGVGHFEVSDEEAKVLMRALRERLPGYLVPKFVEEVAGEKSKLPALRCI